MFYTFGAVLPFFLQHSVKSLPRSVFMVDSGFLSPQFAMHLTFVKNAVGLNFAVGVYSQGTQAEMHTTKFT